MTRLFDRMRSRTLRPVTMYDLAAASKDTPQWQAITSDPSQRERAHNTHPIGRGLDPAFYEQSTVVNADNIVRYVRDQTNGPQHGTGMLLLDHELLDLFGQTSAITVLPPYRVMFIEANPGPNMMGISSFGWTVGRVEDDDGGWQMQAGLIVEWTKGSPTGPLYVLHWSIDKHGRYVRESNGGKPHPSLPDLEISYPTDPRQSDPDLLERMCAPYLDGFNGAVAVLALTLGFMNCKNVVEIVHEPPKQLARAHRKRRGRAPTRFTTLDIRPMTRALKRPGHTQGSGLGQGFHTCRGHFKTYKPESPLFGRLSGQFWWEEHDRGTDENGQVVKDYRQHPPRSRTAPVGESYRRAGAEPREDVGLPHPVLAHARLQDLLADQLLDRGLTVVSPAPDEPQYDLGCEGSHEFWVIEVKTTTAQNEAQQIRSAIGQVLHYREILRAVTQIPIRCAIAVDSKPADPALQRVCSSQGIELTWVDDFESFADKL